jgi:hypothetical protein
MSISIGTSAPPSARETHAAWLRLRGDCQQFLDYVPDGSGSGQPDGAGSGEPARGRTAVVQSRDVTARTEPGDGDVPA